MVFERCLPPERYELAENDGLVGVDAYISDIRTELGHLSRASLRAQQVGSDGEPVQHIFEAAFNESIEQFRHATERVAYVNSLEIKQIRDEMLAVWAAAYLVRTINATARDPMQGPPLLLDLYPDNEGVLGKPFVHVPAEAITNLLPDNGEPVQWYQQHGLYVCRDSLREPSTLLQAEIDTNPALGVLDISQAVALHPTLGSWGLEAA